jgi:hypothetical protein
MQADRAYLERVRSQLADRGLQVRTLLAMSRRPVDSRRRATAVDLIMMSTHGHRFIADLLRPTNRVRHLVKV